MNFTKRTYRVALKRSENRLYALADTLEWSKNHGGDVDQAREAYYTELFLFDGIMKRRDREGVR